MFDEHEYHKQRQLNPPSARRTLGAAVVVGALAMTAHAQWTVVNLHPAGADGSAANAVSGGQQAGSIDVGCCNTHAGMWTGSAASWVDLHPAGATYLNSEAWGVQGGQQVGFVNNSGQNLASLWTGSAASWVNLNPTGPHSSMALGVGGGQQVGVLTSPGVGYGALWSGSAASWMSLSPAGATGAEVRGTDGVQQVGDAYVSGVSRASLWTGSPASWVDLHPAGATLSVAYGVSGGQQVGRAKLGDVYHASLWTGTATSWVDLNPVGAYWSEAHGVYGGQQVGWAQVGGVNRASLWTGSATSWVDLHAFLPSNFANSWADGIWSDGGHVYVVGWGFNSTTTRNEALMWVKLTPLLGDMNCDGLVNGQDIDGFVLALFDPAGYAAQYPTCNILNADMNGDGLVNGQDIDGFVAVLFGG